MSTILALDTSSGSTGVAVCREGEILASSLTVKKFRHAESIFSQIEEVLGKAGVARDDLTGVAVTVGPGSFTGLRVGIATAKGIAFGLGLKIAGVSSLRALMGNAEGFGAIVAPMFDARKGQVYGGAFDGQTGEVVIEEGAWDPEVFTAELLALKRPVHLLGSGVGAYRERIFSGDEVAFTEADESLWNVDPAIVARLGEEEFEKGRQTSPALLKPVYHRLSEAEVNKAKGALVRGLKV